MPKVSVIVPVYKAERTLARCVDSILAQTYTDFELLLIDDGSPDNSGALCDEYARKDPRVRVFHKPNGGVSSARNLGLDNAQGEWISFVDSDDFVYKDFLKNFSNYFNSPSVSLLIQNLKKENESGIISQEYPNISCTIIDLKGVFDVNNGKNIYFQGFVWNKCFKYSIISDNKISFDESLKLYEDEKFLIVYCTKISNDSIRYSNYLGYHYYITPLNFGNKYDNILESQFKVYESVKFNNIPPDFFLERFIWDVFFIWTTNNQTIPKGLLHQLICTVGKDFTRLKGKRRFLFYILKFTKSPFIWKKILNIYFKSIQNKM